MWVSDKASWLTGCIQGLHLNQKIRITAFLSPPQFKTPLFSLESLTVACFSSHTLPGPSFPPHGHYLFLSSHPQMIPGPGDQESSYLNHSQGLTLPLGAAFVLPYLDWTSLSPDLFIYIFNFSSFLKTIVCFSYTVKLFSYIYIYIQILLHYRLLQNIEYSSLCCTVYLCCLSILYIIVCTC